ncbi:gliding motility-associated C-terminal domain-containing protein [Mucilaginibacter sp.]|uniref:T9SS type B sorting domain-containing protein n=1 Tax=Mucilaginibacter sp. TaxID=1882438 RepID=UPI00262A282D|nr:gliding motility-associated C-terminal domain-containing protein [Mucilaginibacter sp.]MDB5126645.1 hypothetical protein [Mucilaginibacter sp.]
MQFKLKFFLPVFLLLFNVPVFAQVCTGSLGDPVFTQDFGSVTNPVTVSTDYTYTSSTCPGDGYYTLGTSTIGCFGNAWHTVTQDHTGNPGGYMMIVNASYTAGEFFKQQTDVGALCENTTYEFSAYIMNLILPNGNHIKPNISFIIETPTGVLIKRYDTDDIPETSGSDGWIKYGTYFTTAPGITQVVVRMVNNAPGGNGNDLLLDDIAFRACGPIVQAGFSGDVSVTENKVCQGDLASYNITSTPPTGYSNSRFQWQQNLNDGNGWKDIPDKTEPSLARDFLPNAPVGSYQYRLGVAEGGNISSLNCRVYSNPVTISITSYPAPPPFPPTSVCEGETLTLTASGGATYKWTLPDLSESTQNPLVIPQASAADSGPYKVEVISAAGCTTPQQVNVTVNPKPVVTIDPIQPICRGSSGTRLTTSINEAGSYTYSWFPVTGLSDANASNPMASPSISTLYTVIATNSITTCSDTAQIRVEVLDLPVANAGSNKKIFEGQSIKLDGSAMGDVTYTWSPPDYLDDPHSPTPIANPPHNMPYLLTVTSANGCGTDEDEVTVTVYEKIVIPSTFTPNNDGVNDIWNIEALETYPQGTITVFTRNGKQVFQSKGYGKPWDGKLNGTLLPTGTYYYVIDLKNDTPNLSGWVLLVR